MRVAGCFLEYDGKFVILHRHSHKSEGDTWGLPADKVEPGEDDKTALLREVFEETGYKGDKSKLQHLGDYEFGKQDKKYIFATYRIVLQSPHDITLESSAHSAYRWVTAKECYAYPNLISDFHELLKRVGLWQ